MIKSDKVPEEIYIYICLLPLSQYRIQVQCGVSSGSVIVTLIK